MKKIIKDMIDEIENDKFLINLFNIIDTFLKIK